MGATEKAAYLKGLLDGLDLDMTSKEGKLFAAMAETIECMAAKIDQLEEVAEGFGDELDDVYDELDLIEEELDEIEECCEECCCDDDCCCDDEDDDEDCCCDGDLYEVTCPTCGEEIVVDEDVMLSGSVKCPACGEELEFDYSELAGECDCGCEDEKKD